MLPTTRYIHYMLSDFLSNYLRTPKLSIRLRLRLLESEQDAWLSHSRQFSSFSLVSIYCGLALKIFNIIIKFSKHIKHWDRFIYLFYSIYLVIHSSQMIDFTRLRKGKCRIINISSLDNCYKRKTYTVLKV